MNYVLQVVRGRSATTTLKLANGVTSLGRHDDCLIRIKSSQVSRRHCEVFESGGKLMVRDLGSSNGTYVNGKRVLGQQALKPGDELTIGAVTLRLATVGSPRVGASEAAAAASEHKPGDTAVVEAVPLEEDQEEFELDFEDAAAKADEDVIPLAGDDATVVVPKPQASKSAPAGKETAGARAEKPAAPPSKESKQEEEAVAQFLLDLNLDDAD
jgi:predicted component of type VI protein secretion system